MEKGVCVLVVQEGLEGVWGFDDLCVLKEMQKLMEKYEKSELFQFSLETNKAVFIPSTLTFCFHVITDLRDYPQMTSQRLSLKP